MTRDAPRPDTRQRILDAASEQFASQGFGDTPLRQISDAVGVTKAALYYHFSSKDEILVALAAPLQDAVGALLDRVEAATVPPGTLLAEYLAVLIRYRDIARLLARDPSVLTHPGIGQTFLSNQARLRRVLAYSVDGGVHADIRAACAVGALQAGLLRMDGDPDADLGAVLVGAALATLGDRPAAHGLPVHKLATTRPAWVGVSDLDRSGT